MVSKGEAYNEILNVVHKLLHAMDRGDGEEFADLFAEHGQLSVRLVNANVSGRDALSKWCTTTHEKFIKCTHWEGNVVIDIMDDMVNTAKTVSYWKALEGGDCMSTGTHRDTFIYQDGKWRVSKRIIEHTWTKALGWVDGESSKSLQR